MAFWDGVYLVWAVTCTDEDFELDTCHVYFML